MRIEDCPTIRGSVPIQAFRAWKLIGGALVSAVRETPWPRRARMESVCLCGDGRPAPDHTCGIYACKELGDLVIAPLGGAGLGHGLPVVGSVALWGRVAEFEEGYRAQFAYPSALYVISSQITRARAAALREAYGVPVYWGPEAIQLVEEIIGQSLALWLEHEIPSRPSRKEFRARKTEILALGGPGTPGPGVPWGSWQQLVILKLLRGETVEPRAFTGLDKPRMPQGRSTSALDSLQVVLDRLAADGWMIQRTAGPLGGECRATYRLIHRCAEPQQAPRCLTRAWPAGDGYIHREAGLRCCTYRRLVASSADEATITCPACLTAPRYGRRAMFWHDAVAGPQARRRTVWRVGQSWHGRDVLNDQPETRLRLASAEAALAWLEEEN